MVMTQSGIDEQCIDELIRNIRRIDRMLEPSVRTLIEYTEEALEAHQEIPLFISAESQPIDKRRYRITQAITCSTLLRLCVLRRRFGFFKKHGMGEKLSKIADLIPARFDSPAKSFQNDEEIFEYIGRQLGSSTFGAMNPLTSSWVFWTLMYAGEAYAHSGLGFLAFFSMFWALERGRSERMGAGLDPWRPTAYITSRCLFPIEMVSGTCQRRADRLKKVKHIIEELERLSLLKTEHDRWMFALNLDLLVSVLHETSGIAIDREAFTRCADALEKLAGDLTPSTTLKTAGGARASSS